MVICFHIFSFFSESMNSLHNRIKTLLCVHLHFQPSVSLQSCSSLQMSGKVFLSSRIGLQLFGKLQKKDVVSWVCVVPQLSFSSWFGSAAYSPTNSWLFFCNGFRHYSFVLIWNGFIWKILTESTFITGHLKFQIQCLAIKLSEASS